MLVVMDPPGTVLVEEDTSFALMFAAQERGHRVDHCLVTDLYLDGGLAAARVRRATCARDPKRPISLGEAEDVHLADVDVVFVRKDPPFDEDYLFASLLLERARGSTLVVNDPRGLRDANEKLYTMHFAELMPPSMVTAHADRIRAFVAEQGGRAVIKPLSGAGGDGIFALDRGDPNFNAIVETVTHRGGKLAMVQRFMPEVAEGDKRILLLNGEVLGAILRVPQGGDLRSNIHVGGRVAAASLDADDRRIAEHIGPRLVQDGLIFVGIDVIGGKLTEVNVTSPTGIQQASAFAGRDLSAAVIEWLESRLG